MTEAPNRYVADAPFPLSSAWGASSYWDTREPNAGWQRVPGCARVVHAAIPDPMPFYAPEWCGERGVPTKSGKVYDYETGREMRDWRSTVGPKPKVAYGSLLKRDKKERS